MTLGHPLQQPSAPWLCAARWLVFGLLWCVLAETGFARIAIRGETMGTYYAVTIDGADEAETDAVRDAVEADLAEVNRQMSTWDSESEISRFNRSTTTDWFDVSAGFAVVVEESRRIHTLTDGAFDPTVAPLIDLWGFGASRRRDIPTDAEIAQALQYTGMDLIDVRRDPPALRKRDARVQLNLSAIAKGYAVDRVSQTLAAAGYTAFVVDIGGENRAGQAKADGSPWRLGVESPLGGLFHVLEVTETSVATSGDYRNYFERDGIRYAHAIDPETGRPLREPPASVSVVTPFCMTADALATALMVMGPERGMALAGREQLSVMFLDVQDGAVVARRSGLFVQPATVDETAGAFWLPFLAALALFLLAIVGMAIGVILKNRELKGSCGGLASMPGNDPQSVCELCSVPRDDCVNPEIREKLTQEARECDSAAG